MNRTTSMPKFIPHFVLDKERLLFVSENGEIYVGGGVVLLLPNSVFT